MFYLVRHGEADYSEKGTKIYQGHGEHFAPLTEQGIKQIANTATDIRLQNAHIILSSPYTRALQSAAILSKELQVDIKIETNLHEWQADKDYNYLNNDFVEKYCSDFNLHNGTYPNGQDFPWETNALLKSRLLKTLNKYNSLAKVIVVCHGMLIHSVIQDHWLENGEIAEFEMEDSE